VKVKVTVGEVEITVTDADYTPRQVTALLHKAASIAVALGATAAVEAEPEHKGAAAGFTAHLELDPERNLEPDLSEWFEEAP
jgi:predicted nucleotidyltransferase